MTYQSGVVAVIKVDGKILRESEGTFYLPFGSEYSILIKNLKTQRILVKVSIDGTDALDGTEIVILDNSEVELERFIKNSNFNSGNKFKFIEMTEDIENHRGIKVDDGFIRIEYWVENIQPVINVPIIQYYPKDYHYYPSYPIINVPIIQSSCNIYNTLNSTVQDFSNSDAGITVAGSKSNQTFESVSSFPVHAQSEVIILKLRGKRGPKIVNKPLLVKTKIECPTCGKSNSSDVKYCPHCGTVLD